MGQVLLVAVLATVLATVLLTVLLTVSACERRRLPDNLLGPLTDPSFAPAPIYSDEPNDAWNALFQALFERLVVARLTDEFEIEPAWRSVSVMGQVDLRVSEQRYLLLESGDRSIEPLFDRRTREDRQREPERTAWDDPERLSLLETLADAVSAQLDRPPLHRALMPADVWAWHDAMFRQKISTSLPAQRRGRLEERRRRLLEAAGRLLRALALSPEEVSALPDNYTAAAESRGLPNLFGDGSQWIEVSWRRPMTHEVEAQYRRIARFFVLPSDPPSDVQAFLDDLRPYQEHHRKLDAVALLLEILLVDTEGRIVRSPLSFEVQIRRFVKSSRGELVRTELRQLELSRKELLDEPGAGGLVELDEASPLYLPTAGNDLGFASPQDDGLAVLGRLRTRCVSCHAGDARLVLTLSAHYDDSPPPIHWVQPSAEDIHRLVGELKEGREDFRALSETAFRGPAEL